MKGKQLGWILSGASALGAALGLLFISGQRSVAADTAEGRVLWMGACFLLMFALGFAGLQLAMQLDRSFRVERQPLCWVAGLLACVLLFAVGAGGQYLFMLSKETVEVSAQVDMVLLLDASGSMDSYGYNNSRRDAACQFVDSLGEDTRLQALSFAGRVIDRTQLIPMDAAGKDGHKQMIRAIDSTGYTDFDQPLREAMDTLNTQGRPDCSKAVVLLTDGESSLDDQVVRDYTGGDIRVFTVRISNATKLNAQERALVDLAQNTGGFDTQLTPRPDGSIETADMLRAFQDAFTATSETRVNMREDLILYAEDGVTVGQFLIRLVVMALCAMAVGFGYFGQISLPALAGNGVSGALAAVLVTLLESSGYFLCSVVTCLLVGTAYVFLDLRGEDHYDV